MKPELQTNNLLVAVLGVLLVTLQVPAPREGLLAHRALDLARVLDQVLPQIVFRGGLEITEVAEHVAELGLVEDLLAGGLALLVSVEAVLVLETLATIVTPELLLVHVHVILVFPLGFEHPGAPLTLVAFSHYTGSPTLTLASSSFFARPKSLFLFSSISQVSSSKEHAELFSEMGAQHFKDL